MQGADGSLAAPLRLLVFGVVLLVLTMVSTFLIVTLVTAIAFGALIAARFVLPAADRLDARLGRPVTWLPFASRAEPTTDRSDATSAGAVLGS